VNAEASLGRLGHRIFCAAMDGHSAWCSLVLRKAKDHAEFTLVSVSPLDSRIEFSPGLASPVWDTPGLEAVHSGMRMKRNEGGSAVDSVSQSHHFVDGMNLFEHSL
jgi:hypothetical protein